MLSTKYPPSKTGNPGDCIESIKWNLYMPIEKYQDQNNNIMPISCPSLCKRSIIII